MRACSSAASSSGASPTRCSTTPRTSASASSLSQRYHYSRSYAGMRNAELGPKRFALRARLAADPAADVRAHREQRARAAPATRASSPLATPLILLYMTRLGRRRGDRLRLRRRAQPAAGAVRRCESESTRPAGRTAADSAASHATRSAGWSSSTRRPSTSSSSTSRRADGASCRPGADARAVRLKAPPGEAAAPDRAGRSPTCFRLTRAVRRDRLDAFLFPSVYTYFPVRRHADRRRSARHDRRAHAGAHRPLAARARCWRGSSSSSPSGAPAGSSPSPRPRGRRSRRSFGIPAGAARGRPRGAGPGVRAAERRRLVARPAPKPGSTGARPLLPLRGRDQPAQERRDADRRVRAALGGRRTAPRCSCSSATSRARRTSRRRRRCASGSRAHGLGDDVLLPGFVSDEALAASTAAPRRVVIPSLAEGFGLPAVEAAACGAAVAAQRPAGASRDARTTPRSSSRRPTWRRSPRFSAACASDESLRSDVATRARDAVAGLTWDAAADRLRTLIHEAARLR